tara:strand:- start:222 stop:1574 length:1353 start_codon:yes stop_codon:yes gene_type:complete
MIYNVLVAGSGLSSMAFLSSFAKKKNKVYVISPIRKKKVKSFNNSHITTNLPPQYLNKKDEIDNYFYWNNITVNKTSYLIGSLGYGGLSNSWGYQIEKDFEKDISHFSKKNQKLIKESFNFLFNENQTKMNLKKGIFKDLLNIKFKNFFFKNADIARLKNDRNPFFSEKNKMNSKNFFDYHLKNKNLIFLDYVIKKIAKKNKLIELHIIDNKGIEKKIYAKKLILGTGTIVTTKLVSEYLNISDEIRIKHHPRIIFSFLGKKPTRLKNKIESETKAFAYSNRNFVVDFRPNAIAIMDVIKKNFNNLGVNLFLNIFKKKLIFSNVFISSKFSSLYMKTNNGQTLIFSETNNFKTDKINKIKETVLELKNELSKQKLIYPFYKTFIPNAGADYHYFGSMKINNKKFGVNENFQLNANKNIYIIDGTCMDYKNTFYPMGVTMANARRIGYLLK